MYIHKVTFISHSQDIVSEHPERFFVAEIVREKIFMQFRDEVPYACQVCNKVSQDQLIAFGPQPTKIQHLTNLDIWLPLYIL